MTDVDCVSLRALLDVEELFTDVGSEWVLNNADFIAQ